MSKVRNTPLIYNNNNFFLLSAFPVKTWPTKALIIVLPWSLHYITILYLAMHTLFPLGEHSPNVRAETVNNKSVNEV